MARSSRLTSAVRRVTATAALTTAITGAPAGAAFASAATVSAAVAPDPAAQTRAPAAHTAHVVRISHAPHVSHTPRATRAARATHRLHRTRRVARPSSYPYATASTSQTDPWGATKRQCTSFASWALTRGGVLIDPHGSLTGPRGSAYLRDARTWEAAARAAGYQVLASPVVGAVAHWRAGETSTWTAQGVTSRVRADATGHVGIVRAVLPGGLAVIDDYNSRSPNAFAEWVGRAPRYLVITP